MRKPDFPVYGNSIIECMFQQESKVEVEPVTKCAVHEFCDYSALAAIRLYIFLYAHSFIFYATRKIFELPLSEFELSQFLSY